MNNASKQVLKNDERAMYALRALYHDYGYARFKVGKFEEYDLYAHNKNFLISENILTFTETNGKLMALKPDVTLSIIKNIGNDDISTHKVYYNENVYRTSQGSDGFREIMQTGLECIGNIGLYEMGEVLMLAQKSLALISDDYILDLSHMGFVTGLLENAGIDTADTAKLLSLIGTKNIPAIKAYCASHAVGATVTESICAITALYEPIEPALERIAPMVAGDKMREAYEQLLGVTALLREWGDTSRVYLDFSIVNDKNYYNGIIFRGFLNGLSDGILSGGRYDSLLAKMGKRGGAIGFAVYLDLLERWGDEQPKFDVDVLLTATAETNPANIVRAVQALRADGNSVLVQNGTGGVRYRQLMQVDREGGAIVLEAND